MADGPSLPLTAGALAANNNGALAANSNTLRDSVDFWRSHVSKSLANGTPVDGTRSSLLSGYPQLSDELSTHFVNWLQPRIQTNPAAVAIELLCDYPAPLHCKKYQIQGDDWMDELPHLRNLARRIYGALLQPYDTPSALNAAQLNKFTKGQAKALTLLNQQLGTSGGKHCAQLYCMKMARTIICVNKNGLSNEFTTVFDKKGNKAENREARYQQIKCSVRAPKVCDVIRANKLLALDVATGKILQKIARDPDYELHNKVGHVKSNCKRDEQLQAAHAAQVADSDSQDESGGRKGKKRGRFCETKKTQPFEPDDAIDAVDPESSYFGGETNGYTILEGDAGEADGDDDNEEINAQLAEPLSLRKKATPRSRLPTSSGFDGFTCSFNTEVAQPARNNTAETTSYHPFSQYPFGQYSTETTQQIYDNLFSRVNGRHNDNNVTATGYPTTQQQQPAQVARMHANQPQNSVRGFHAPPSASFGIPNMQSSNNLMDTTSFNSDVGMLHTPINFGPSTLFDFDPSALNFGMGNNEKGSNVDDA